MSTICVMNKLPGARAPCARAPGAHYTSNGIKQTPNGVLLLSRYQPTNQQPTNQPTSKQQKKKMTTNATSFTKRELGQQIFGFAMAHFPAPKGGAFYFVHHLAQLRDALAKYGYTTDEQIEEFICHILIGYDHWRYIDDPQVFEGDYDPDRATTPGDILYTLREMYTALPSTINDMDKICAEIIGIAHSALHTPKDSKGTVYAISMFVNGQWGLVNASDAVESFVMALVGQISTAFETRIGTSGFLRTEFGESHIDPQSNRSVFEEYVHQEWKRVLNRFLELKKRPLLKDDDCIYTTDPEKHRRAVQKCRIERDRLMRCKHEQWAAQRAAIIAGDANATDAPQS